jgi:DNA repair protein RecN (Recombination protein N)
MLKSLNISNFAVIRSLEVEFHQGLNLLTGETGSGKSIIVDALGLLIGGRASVSLLRTGERLAVIEGLFEIVRAQKESVGAILAESGIEQASPRELSVRREVHASGKSRVLVDDQSATASALKALQPFLVDIHGQGEQRALLSAQTQMHLLDSFGGCLAQRREVAAKFSSWQSALGGLRRLKNELTDRALTEDLLRYQLSELEAVNPKAGEEEELLEERKLLLNAERIAVLRGGAYMGLYESDDSVLARLAAIRRQLEELSAIDSRAGAASEALIASVISLTEVADFLRGYGAGVEFSRRRLDEVEGRLADLERLRRKYNTDAHGLIKVVKDLEGRLNRLENLAEAEAVLSEGVRKSFEGYMASARLLTGCRRNAVAGLERGVMEELSFIAMERARFVVSIRTYGPAAAGAEEGDAAEGSATEDFYTADGVDRIEFLLSANPGESPRPLSQAASGGELSRLMLALRTVGAGATGSAGLSSETIVFDEIDVGIGGRAAEAVGRRLKELSKGGQVLCVTHQPQIARFADHHYFVEKSVKSGRTLTAVRELSGGERVRELARMIGGDEEAESAREAARWLLGSVKKGARARRQAGADGPRGAK